MIVIVFVLNIPYTYIYLNTQMKKSLGDHEAITNEIVAQSHIESVGLKLFEYADKQDREANFHKCVNPTCHKFFFQIITTLCFLQKHDQGFLHVQSHIFLAEAVWRPIRGGLLEITL